MVARLTVLSFSNEHEFCLVTDKKGNEPFCVSKMISIMEQARGKQKMKKDEKRKSQQQWAIK